ncbi:MAG: transposase [Chitinophagaceae bacterium]|nr:transposase [Chitinophagaceae bacterium]
MSKYKKQSHVVCKCDYHIVWVPKYRFRIVTGEVGRLMATDIRMYSEWLGCEIIELNVQSRGYFVNTVGINEDMIRRYVKYQEAEERKEESNQQGFGFDLGI